MSVDAVVVNYNAGSYLVECVKSLLSNPEVHSIRVVDNASTDDSLARLEHEFSRQPVLHIRKNADNQGFARAVNAAAANCTEEFILIINPDCTVESNTIHKLMAALREDPQAAISGPAVRDVRGQLEKAACRRFPNPWRSLMALTGLWRFSARNPSLQGISYLPGEIPVKTEVTEAISGACLLVRRSAFQDIGGMDEDYKLHCEDLDLMYRLHQNGFHCLFVPDASATHVQGVSSRSRRMWVHRQKHISMLRFFRKFQAPDYSMPVRWLVTLGVHGKCMALFPWIWLKR